MRKINKFLNLLITSVLFGILFASCEKDISEISQLPDNETVIVSVLGKKLENPYSVENMQKALDNLLGNLKNSGDSITASHYYVKFIPLNDDELSLLKNDTTMAVYQYPLDYEVIDGSTTYHDPQVPPGQPTYQYAAVPLDFLFPEVGYEILEELFIPEEASGLKAGLPVAVEDLVTEALRITNNLDEGSITKSGNWRPAGTMRVWDDNFNAYVPVVGLEVRARRWFTTHTGITNANGYYSCNGTFKREANYSLQFERYHFEIRDGWLSTANINGPKKKGDWNLDMKNDKREFWATIFRATYHYYHQDIKSLRRPPLNSFWNTQLKLRAVYEENSSNGTHCASCRFLGLGSAIKIYNPQNNSMEIYGTTIHEIAHASHWNMTSWHYNNASTIVKESWARGVQWELTRMVYPPNIMGDYPSYVSGDYTGVVQDMIDGISGYDQVTGYTIRQIEDALNGEIHWNNWKNKIFNSYNNATKNNLDALFDYWD